MHLSINIVGDAFADVYCYLEEGLPEQGGDARLSQPMHTVAGGSGLNTATHLASLMHQFWTSDSADVPRTSSVNLQTVINENDEWGQLLVSHCDRHRFSLINRRISSIPSCFLGTNEAAQSQRREKSTGHCAVIVSNGDRSFMTHLGCIADFRGSHILLNLETGNEPSLQHVHIAGFYNIAGFWHGELACKLAEMREMATKANQTLTVSLVPQHDATEEWDGGLLDLLQCIDFLILSEVEAIYITKYQCGGKIDDEAKFCDHIARFSRTRSPKTYIIVTLGSNGAVAVREGDIVHRQSTVPQIPIDPTGAGDAFAAGFLHGYLSHEENTAGDEVTKEAVKAGLRWGCAVGTCSVMLRGASAPSGKTAVEGILSSIEKCEPNDAKRCRVTKD